jgi:hypothetical protein
MNVKLTLTVDKAVIMKAKIAAHKSGRSLSNMVETYLKTQISKEEAEQQPPYSPLISSLKGSIPLPEVIDYKEELKSSLTKKYR